MKIIEMKLATNREDGGKTENYRVYGGGGTVQVENRRGEKVSKNVILGGNGTIYIANEVAADHTAFVILPKADYDRLVKAVPAAVQPALKKGKK